MLPMFNPGEKFQGFITFAAANQILFSLEDIDSALFIFNTAGFIVAAVINEFTLSIILGFALILILLICSALVSGSEIAFFSLNPLQIQGLRNITSKSGQRTMNLLERPKRLLATILISNNFLNVAIVILSTYVTQQLFNLTPLMEFIMLAILVSALILLFGEIIPKMYATRHNIKFALFMAPALNFLIKLFYPISSILVRSTSVIDKRLAKKKSNLSISDLSDAIEITSNESTPVEERKILKGIVKFGDIDVKEIMKSRVDVVAVEVEMPFSEMLKVIIDSGYSRIPVYSDSFDKIKGILYVKDLLAHLEVKGDFSWPNLIRDAFFIPENKKIKDLLQEFQEKKIHMAIVVDEYGGTSGIVTLEDIIEEIFGEISDEFDTMEDEIEFKKIDDHNYIFEGKTTINDFCKIIDIEGGIFDKVKGESDSLAGLILELEGNIPPKDTVISYKNFDFKILASDDRRIKKIRIHIKHDKSSDA